MLDSKIDLERVGQLIAAMERDLHQLPPNSSDVKHLRDEVAALKQLLSVPVEKHQGIRERLHGIHAALDNAMDVAVADGMQTGQYIAEIGRILGL